MTASWVSAFGTLLAVMVALFLAGADARRRAREKARDQAEKVSAWMDYIPVTDAADQGSIQMSLAIQNASNQLIYNTIASVVFAHSGEHVGDNLSYRNYLGRVPPGRTDYRIEHPGNGMHKRFSIELAFTDSGGRIWVRSGMGSLAQIKKEPLSYYGIDPPVEWRMP